MQKTAHEYLSSGMSPSMAAYFAGARRQIRDVTPLSNYRLLLTFDNAERRIYDLSGHILPGSVFAPLLDPDRFRRVFLDDSHCVCWDIDPKVDSSVVWSNRIDLCPDTCYVESLPVSDHDVIDLVLFEEALAEHQKDPITHTFDEALQELGIARDDRSQKED